MRRALVVFHRVAGLFTASFLFIAGLSGAVIAWDHELDEVLNPQLFRVEEGRSVDGESILSVANAYERQHSGKIAYLPLSVADGHSLGVFIRGGAETESRPIQVFLHPTHGEVLGSRVWGERRLSRENLLPWLYRLHESLHIPSRFGLDLGVLWMGMIALVWCADTLISLAISFPPRAPVWHSFMFHLRGGSARRWFDLHRSLGVWISMPLLALAVSGTCLSLEAPVIRPMFAKVLALTPTPAESRGSSVMRAPSTEAITREQALSLAWVEARRRGLKEQPGALWHDAEQGIFGVGFFAAGDEHPSYSIGHPWVYLDDVSGECLAFNQPGGGTMADTFLRAQYSVHSGRLGGVGGRVLVTFFGVLVAGLSATGVRLYVRRHVRRRLAARDARVSRDEGVRGFETEKTNA
ncbi:MAG: hypothetical protein RL385_831 [Pseudomonadota bacterium]|jgi:uncharacterized iron-regulated membrane protein